MAMIHETLYDTKDFSRINLSSYVHALSQSLFNTHNIHPEKIDLNILTDKLVYVDITKAIPCGLVLNELICNALKHAFPGRRKGKLQIMISETKKTKIAIMVRDNGVGLPDNIDILKPQTLGLQLVNGLVTNQLNGHMEVRRDNGTEMRIIFPI
jgi:two-component sensor histidine kinase